MRTADTACVTTLPEGKAMALPGDNFTTNLKLEYPLPLTIGLRFALREGGKTVASGVISKLLEDTKEDLAEEDVRNAKKKGGSK